MRNFDFIQACAQEIVDQVVLYTSPNQTLLTLTIPQGQDDFTTQAIAKVLRQNGFDVFIKGKEFVVSWKKFTKTNA